MPAILKTVEASISANGVITPSEPITGPAKAVVTLLIEQPDPNGETIRAMEEPIESLPRFDTVEELKEDLSMPPPLTSHPNHRLASPARPIHRNRA